MASAMMTMGVVSKPTYGQKKSRPHQAAPFPPPPPVPLVASVSISHAFRARAAAPVCRTNCEWGKIILRELGWALENAAAC